MSSISLRLVPTISTALSYSTYLQGCFLMKSLPNIISHQHEHIIAQSMLFVLWEEIACDYHQLKKSLMIPYIEEGQTTHVRNISCNVTHLFMGEIGVYGEDHHLPEVTDKLSHTMLYGVHIVKAHNVTGDRSLSHN